jgi:hypothetical protein
MKRLILSLIPERARREKSPQGGHTSDLSGRSITKSAHLLKVISQPAVYTLVDFLKRLKDYPQFNESGSWEGLEKRLWSFKKGRNINEIRPLVRTVEREHMQMR